MPLKLLRGASPERSRRLEHGLVLFTALLALWHLAQGWSPLRLSADGVHFLQVAASVADGAGYLYQGTATYYPHGYPTLIAVLDRAGLGISWMIFGVNYVFAGCGLWAVYRIARGPYCLERWMGLLVVALSLLSYVFIKHVPLPMSDIAYFGLATLSIWFLAHAASFPDGRRWLPLVAGAALAAVAIWFRTVGIALVPAVLWAAFVGNSPFRIPLLRLARSRLGAATLGLAALLAFGVAGLFVIDTQAKYLHELALYFDAMHRLGWEAALHNRALVLGGLLLNVPASQLPAALSPWIALAGVALVLVAGYGAWLRRRQLAVVDVYLLAYLGIVTVWPAGDARFYLPVLPLLMLWGAIGIRQVVAERAPRIGPVVVVIYLLGFASAGTAALAYSTSLTFAGDTFPARYGSGAFAAEYRTAFDGPHPSAMAGSIPALEVLVRYEPRTNAYFRALPEYPRISSALEASLFSKPPVP